MLVDLSEPSPTVLASFPAERSLRVGRWASVNSRRARHLGVTTLTFVVATGEQQEDQAFASLGRRMMAPDPGAAVDELPRRSMIDTNSHGVLYSVASRSQAPDGSQIGLTIPARAAGTESGVRPG